MSDYIEKIKDFNEDIDKTKPHCFFFTGLNIPHLQYEPIYNKLKTTYNVTILNINNDILDNIENRLYQLVDKAFFNIPIHKLPIRCSDIKRKTFYGHNKQWDKNFDVVKEFIMKLVDTICDFRKIFVNNNPTWIENDLTTDILGSVITNISKVYDEQTVKKIVQHISERTKIDK